MFTSFFWYFRVLRPEKKYPGVDLPFPHSTPYMPEFFLKHLCFSTKNLRIRRSTWRPPTPSGSTGHLKDIYHFIYINSTNEKMGSRNGVIQVSMEDVVGLQTALTELMEEIQAYKSDAPP